MLFLFCEEGVEISNDRIKKHAFDIFSVMRHEVEKPIYATVKYVQKTT